MLRVGGNDIGIDRHRTHGNVLAHCAQPGEIVGVDWKLVYGDVIGGLGGVRPPKNGIGSRVENVLGVWAGQVGGERDIKGMMDDRITNLGRRDG